MRRTQHRNKTIRKLTYYRKKGLTKSEIISVTHEKPTMSFEDFTSIAISIGFRNIQISKGYQWVVLRK